MIQMYVAVQWVFPNMLSKHAKSSSTSVNKIETHKIKSVSKMQKQEPPA
jgi:hypothetical protein